MRQFYARHPQSVVGGRRKENCACNNSNNICSIAIHKYDRNNGEIVAIVIIIITYDLEKKKKTNGESGCFPYDIVLRSVGRHHHAYCISSYSFLLVTIFRVGEYTPLYEP